MGEPVEALTGSANSVARILPCTARAPTFSTGCFLIEAREALEVERDLVSDLLRPYPDNRGSGSK